MQKHSEQKQQTIDLIAGVLSTIPVQPSKMHPETQREMATQVTDVVAANLLEREWRCWREDGSYYGPCTPDKLVEWDETPCVHGETVPHPHPDRDFEDDGSELFGILHPPCPGGGWSHRHADCGWQHYIMARDLISTEDLADFAGEAEFKIGGTD